MNASKTSSLEKLRLYLECSCDSLLTVRVKSAVNFLRVCVWTQTLTSSLLNSSGFWQTFVTSFMVKGRQTGG